MKISKVTKKAGAWMALAGAVGLAGCASNRVELDYTDYAGEPVKSFYMSHFDGWNAISKDQLVVYSGLNKAHLLTLSGYCPDLQFAHAIAITSTGNTVDRFEKVLVGRDRCLIKEIRPLDVKQMKADRKLIREQLKQGTIENKQTS
jgi:hypothetical protein